MPQPPNAVSPPNPPASSPADSPQPSRAGRWVQRADLFLRVMIGLYLGLILFFLPWTHLWMFNRFFMYYSGVARIMQHGAVRGMVSGLGLLNLWIAISDAIHYKEV